MFRSAQNTVRVNAIPLMMSLSKVIPLLALSFPADKTPSLLLKIHWLTGVSITEEHIQGGITL